MYTCIYTHIPTHTCTYMHIPGKISILFSTYDNNFSSLRNAGSFSSMLYLSRELFETLRRGAAGRTWHGN